MYSGGDCQETDAAPLPKRRCIRVLSPIPTDLQQNDLFYSMKKPDRGLAIVLSHEFYDKIDGKGVPVRSGTSNDVERLKDTLSDLGFQVDVKKDLTHKEICRLISNVSKREDLREHDCLAVFVLTHGDEHDRVYAKDKTYFIKELIEPFTGENCPNLANKPKLFFIQACKGVRLQNRVDLRTMTDSARKKNASGRGVMYSIPADSDVLISYATLEGYTAVRDPTSGTPYIMCLCDELKKNGTTLDLLSILTRVHHNLATSVYSIVGTNEKTKVQASFLCYLNRFVKFSTPALLKAQHSSMTSLNLVV